MSKFSTILFFLSLLLSVTGIAQESNNSKKATKLFKEGQALIGQRKVFEGIESLKKATEKDPEFADAYFALGNAYNFIFQYKQASEYYERALSLEPGAERFNYANYLLAKSYIQEGAYQKTKHFALQYLKLEPNGRWSSDAEKFILTSDFAMNQMEKPVPIFPEPLGEPFNQFEFQYFPVLTADGNQMVFTIRNPLSPIRDEDIVISENVNGEWTIPQSLSAEINTRKNEGTTSISADGRQMVFTSCDPSKGCDLFYTEKIGEEWTKPKAFPRHINSPNRETQPSLSADGRTLYFVSDRPGGQGKHDIWVTYKNVNGNWSHPFNLGEEINTRGNEISPFIHADNQTLYFSSDGHLGMGDYDLFRSRKKNRTEWTKPQNLGYPINTHAGETSLFITADQKKGYYSIDKMKNLKLDSSVLMSFDLPVKLRTQTKTTYAKGHIYDANTKKALRADVELFNLKQDSLVFKTLSDSINGSYMLVLNDSNRYGAFIYKKGYLHKSIQFDFTNGSEFNPVQLKIYLTPIQKDAKIRLENIFFATGAFQLEDDSKAELMQIVKFLKYNPSLQIEISGHTDNVGQRKENYVLSEKRARSVVEFLVNQGISQSRLKFKGYADTVPLKDNSSEENRKFNRRIELKVIQTN